jgi:large subunit ribosomal protein L3
MLALIGRKVGMTQLFNEQGMRIPVSVIQVEPNVVVRERTADKHGYSAKVLGADKLKKSRIRKPIAGQFPQGTDPTRFLLEFKDFEKECKVGGRAGRGDL